MKNTTILILGFIIIIAIGGFVFANLENNQTGNTVNNAVSGNVAETNNGNMQKITLSMKNGNYYPNTIKVKANEPVSISLDSSIRGCYRAFTIRQLGIAKRLATPSDTLNFTPTQKGTYRFACSMGMGYGTLIVE